MSIIDNALQALLKISTRELVWQNASPESSFAEQNIPLNLSDARGVCIGYRYSASSDTWREEIVEKGKSVTCIYHVNVPTDNAYTYHASRSISVDGNGVSFGDAYTKSVQSQDATINNARVTPTVIYKLGGVIHNLITLATHPRREVLA